MTLVSSPFATIITGGGADGYHSDSPSYGVIVVETDSVQHTTIGIDVLQTLQCTDTVILVDDHSHTAIASVIQQADELIVRRCSRYGRGMPVDAAVREARQGPLDTLALVIRVQIAPSSNELAHLLSSALVGTAPAAHNSALPQHHTCEPLAVQRLFYLDTDTDGAGADTNAAGQPCTTSEQYASPPPPTSRHVAAGVDSQVLAHRATTIPACRPRQRSSQYRRAGYVLPFLDALLRLIGQHRPLLCLGMSGLFVLLTGIVFAVWIVSIYQTTPLLALGYAMINIVVIFLSMFLIFTGLILHSVRGIILGSEAASRRCYDRHYITPATRQWYRCRP